MSDRNTHSGPVVADQAVFTSIRTPTGEGYRIIAASTGLKPEERAEITRRAPSHDSLCSPDEATIGMISFRMPTGRYCVGFCQYAGKEQTSRGGDRVHTHFAVLPAEGFAAFGNNPGRVHAAIGQQVHGQPILKQLTTFETMNLDPRCAASVAPCDRDGCAGVLALISPALSGETVLVCGFNGLPSSLAMLWSAAPKSARPAISLSVGIKFSPTRQTQLNLTGQGIQEAERVLRGLRVSCMDWTSPKAADAGMWAPWINFVRKRSSWGRGADVDELTSTMDEPMPAESLARVAALCDDLDAVMIADLPRLEKLTARYRGHRPACSTEVNLLQRFERAARVREAALRPMQTA